MIESDNSLELTSDEVNNRLDELYTELKTLKPYLPFQQIKRVLAELKWIISMRENSSVIDQGSSSELLSSITFFSRSLGISS